MMRLDREAARRRGVSMLILASVVHVGFCLAVAKLGHALVSLGDEPSRGSMVSLGVAAVIVLAPIVSRIFAALGRWALEPSTAAKLSLGLVLLAIAWLCLGVGIEWSGGQAVGPRTLGACAAALILATICVGLASSAAIDELATPAQRRPWLAIWSLIQLSAALCVSVADRPSPTLSELFESSVVIGLGCVAASVGLAFVWRSFTTTACELATELGVAEEPTTRSGAIGLPEPRVGL